MSRVFVVQNPHHRVDGRLVPKFDLTPAEAHGELIFLLSPSARPFSPDHLIAELRTKLTDFCDNDSLLLIGNPVLIGLAVAIASRANKNRIGVLQWSGQERRYVRIDAHLSES